MTCSNNCETMKSLFELCMEEDFDIDLVQAVLCQDCASDLRDYSPTRKERLAAWLKLREVILPPPELEDEAILRSVGCKMQWVKAAAKKMLCPYCAKEIDIEEQIGSFYPQVVTDAEGNVVNVVLHVGRASKGVGAAKSAIGLLIQEALEWGMPIERIIKKLKGHASGSGGLRWKGQLIHSFEDGVGKGIEYLVKTAVTAATGKDEK